jgi:hypothetical protein
MEYSQGYSRVLTHRPLHQRVARVVQPRSRQLERLGEVEVLRQILRHSRSSLVLTVIESTHSTHSTRGTRGTLSAPGVLTVLTGTQEGRMGLTVIDAWYSQGYSQVLTASTAPGAHSAPSTAWRSAHSREVRVQRRAG